MNSRHQAIRSQISVMCHDRAMDYVKAFHLRTDEESVIIECDVNGLSVVQAVEKLHLSPEALKERRRRAYAKIADAIEYAKEKSREG